MNTDEIFRNANPLIKKQLIILVMFSFFNTVKQWKYPACVQWILQSQGMYCSGEHHNSKCQYWTIANKNKWSLRSVWRFALLSAFQFDIFYSASHVTNNYNKLLCAEVLCRNAYCHNYWMTTTFIQVLVMYSMQPIISVISKLQQLISFCNHCWDI